MVKEIETLYRIRNVHTGLWWGKKQRFAKDAWRKRPERFLSKSALVLVLKAIPRNELKCCEVVPYKVTRVDQVPLNPECFIMKDRR